MKDFYDVIDCVIVGLEKKSKIISEGEKKVIVYYEVGYVIVSWFLKYVDNLLKVFVVFWGWFFGVVWYLFQEYVIYNID